MGQSFDLVKTGSGTVAVFGVEAALGGLLVGGDRQCSLPQRGLAFASEGMKQAFFLQH